MKKFVVTILALIYISSSTGAVLHMHYCMGKLADWGLGHNTAKTCGQCGMEKSEEKDNGCCKDEVKLVKNDTDHQKAGVNTLLNTILVPAITTPVPDYKFQPFLQITEKYSPCHSPPGVCDIQLHVLHCVFLI